MKSLLLLASVLALVSLASAASIYNPKISYHAAATLEALQTKDNSALTSWTCEPCHRFPANNIRLFNGGNSASKGLVGFLPTINSVIVALEGVHNMDGFWKGIQMTQTDYKGCSNCKVHTGLLKIEKDIRGEVISRVKSLLAIYPTANILLTGSNLAGAVVQLLALELVKNFKRVPQVYTFGASRVGNREFARFLTNRIKDNFRVVFHADSASVYPKRMTGFQHAGVEIWFPENKKSYRKCSTVNGLESSKCRNSLSTFTFFQMWRYKVKNYRRIVEHNYRKQSCEAASRKKACQQIHKPMSRQNALAPHTPQPPQVPQIPQVPKVPKVPQVLQVPLTPQVQQIPQSQKQLIVNPQTKSIPNQVPLALNSVNPQLLILRSQANTIAANKALISLLSQNLKNITKKEKNIHKIKLKEKLKTEVNAHIRTQGSQTEQEQNEKHHEKLPAQLSTPKQEALGNQEPVWRNSLSINHGK